MDWQTIELHGYAYYSSRGYRVLVPLVRHTGYDFAIEKGGEFLRINVKVAGLKDKKDIHSWAISRASGVAGNRVSRPPRSVDMFLVWLPQENRFIELPGDFLGKGHSKHRRIPRQLL